MSHSNGSKRPSRAVLWAGHCRGRIRVDLAMVACLGLLGCAPKAPPPPAARGGGKPAPVLVAEVVQKNLPRQVSTFGTGEAYATVAVKSMVAGQMLRCHITPGQTVTQGDLLFTIDSRPFEATLKQLEATLARNRVLAADAQRQAEMAKDLRQKGIAAEDETKKAQAVADALQATLLADQANIEKARLDLEYCAIRAPLSGRTGDLLVREGSVIKANDIAMVEIAQTMPLYVVFSVPEVYLPDIRKYRAAGSLLVEVRPRDASEAITGGELAFMDNTVDVETGTIRLKATFPNQAEQLWPGQFVSVILTLTQEESGVVVPAQAIQNGQAGTFAFVVRQDQTVEMRRLTVARTQGDEAVIGSGLQAGEIVVTDGQVRLVPGAKVEISTPGGRPEAARGEAARGEARNGETAKGETARGEGRNGETARGETAKPEAARGETAKPEAAREGAARP